MRSSLARVVIASLGVSVVITLGCGRRPWEPQLELLTSLAGSISISPSEGGSSVAATVAKIKGAGFSSDATVTVDGSRVDATVLDPFTISLTMPAHAAGTVNVTVSTPHNQRQVSVAGGYTYVGPPVISEVLPNIGSTGGGTPINILGTGVWRAKTVMVDGIVSNFEWDWPDDSLFLSAPAHAAGTVAVIVTDLYGQSGSGEFTYTSPDTFDFNGDWRAWEAPPNFLLTIRDNTVVSISCGSASSLTLDPPPVVANGEFSFADSGGVSLAGKIVSPNFATGTISVASCLSQKWIAKK